MTTDDAIAEITHYMRSDAWCDAPSNEACEVALAALQAHYEKESPYPDGDTSIIACPRCGSGEFLYNEDLADALRMAASAADDHAALVSMRGAVCAWAYQAQALEQIPEDQREDKTRRLLSNIAALARVWGLVGKMDDLAQAGTGEKEHEQR